MSDAPELPPLPEWIDRGEMWLTREMLLAEFYGYGRACQKPLLAEIERLKNEIDSAQGHERFVVKQRDDLRAKLEMVQKAPDPAPCVMCSQPIHFRIGAIALPHTCMGTGSAIIDATRADKP